jgi:Zn-dependent protease
MPMTRIFQSSIRLFRFAGVDLYLHWSWFLVAAFEISRRTKTYSSPFWAVLEYLALLFIVLLHEYGHALACRQVGGRANKIVLWPFGGAASLSPPMRPGATLWSVAAGPLVNVVLLAAFSILIRSSLSLGWAETMPNASALLRMIWIVNLVMLAFNLLPIYPLDGGQILRSLLWFVTSRARSLLLVAVTGFLGVVGFMTLAWWKRSIWFAALSVLVLIHCWRGLKQAKALCRLSALPHHDGFACRFCKAEPPQGKFWRCEECSYAFDTFQTQAACPRCAAQFDLTQCMDCGEWQPMADWLTAAHVALNSDRLQCSSQDAQIKMPSHAA